MSNHDSEKNENICSPFWPIFIVFAVLVLLQIMDTRTGFQRRKQIKAALVEYSAMLPKATTIEQTVEKVGRDLLTLSDGNTNEAAKIIAEFKIRLNPPAPGAAATP